MDQDSESPVLAEPISHSTFSAEAIAKLIVRHYGPRTVIGSTLLRNGFNDVYEIEFEGGQSAIARLSGRLYRGQANVDYELALLEHLRIRDVSSVRPIRTQSDQRYIKVDAPEGSRALALFEKLQGRPAKEPREFQLVGAELARVHIESRDFAGAPSRYCLDSDHLVHKPTSRILALRHVAASVKHRVQRVADQIVGRLEHQALIRVLCHGDCHGGNSFLCRDRGGALGAWLFDFDDGGPGPLSYDLAIFLWSRLLATRSNILEGRGLEDWRSFVAGYSTIQPILEADWRAIGPCVAIRQLWLMGEFAGRVPMKGVEAIGDAWFERMTDLLERWAELQTPAFTELQQDLFDD